MQKIRDKIFFLKKTVDVINCARIFIICTYFHFFFEHMTHQNNKRISI